MSFKSLFIDGTTEHIDCGPNYEEQLAEFVWEGTTLRVYGCRRCLKVWLLDMDVWQQAQEDFHIDEKVEREVGGYLDLL